MHIDLGFDTVLAQGLADQRSDGQVGHIVVVHDVEVHDVRARGDDIVDFLAQARKIRRQDRRGDLVVPHTHNLCSCVGEGNGTRAECGTLPDQHPIFSLLPPPPIAYS